MSDNGSFLTEELNGSRAINPHGLLVHLLWAKKTQLEMIIDRGFALVIPNFPAQLPKASRVIDFTRDPELLEIERAINDGRLNQPIEILNAYRTYLSQRGIPLESTYLLSALSRVYPLAGQESNLQQTLAVIYHIESGVGGTRAREKLHKESEEGLNQNIDRIFSTTLGNKYIIVTRDSLQEDTYNKLSEATGRHIWVFGVLQLRVNVTKHSQVPKHERCTPEVTKFHLSQQDPKKFPVLYDTDPIAQYYGFLPKDLIRIERNAIEMTSEVTESVGYRLVFAAPPLRAGKKKFS